MILIVLTVMAQVSLQPRYDWRPSPQTDREAALAACFRDAPHRNTRTAWLDKCLKEAR